MIIVHKNKKGWNNINSIEVSSKLVFYIFKDSGFLKRQRSISITNKIKYLKKLITVH